MENQQELILAGVAEESPPVAEQPGVPVVGIDIPLGLDVGQPVRSPPPPESPSPALWDDGDVFLDIYDRADLLLLQDWMEHTRIMQGGLGYVVVSPLITERLKTFLQVVHGPQWEAKFLRGGEMILAQLGAYVSGYWVLTGFQREQWDRLFPVWTTVELRAQLKKLAESGGFIEVE